MKKLSKILAVVLALALTVGLSVSLTVAYLSDTDEQVNTMTLGNVYIEQNEYERVTDADGNYTTDTIDNQESYVLQDFTQDKPLLPVPVNPGSGKPGSGWETTTVRMTQVNSYGGMQVFEAANAQDKFVTVTNTGLSDAYVRTLVAVEVGTADPDLIGISYHQTWAKNEIGVVAIDGTDYFVYEFQYNGGELSDGSWRHQYGILPAGDTSYPNLSQVYLRAEATNEDCEAIDGNDNGKVDILVLSQAIQAAGFETAADAFEAGYGDVATNAAEWFETVLANQLP